MRKYFLLFLLLALLLPQVHGKKREKRSIVRLETSMGNIRIALSDDTPIHRNNFLKLTEKGFYDNTRFHRIVKDFMIQGGAPSSPNDSVHQESPEKDGPGYYLAPEFCLPFLYHKRGAVAMARLGDEINPERLSNGSQFYIVWGKKYNETDLRRIQAQLDEATGGEARITLDMALDYKSIGGAPFLDGQYTVFGEVIEGLDIVEKIQSVQTNSAHCPGQDITILRAIVEQKSKKALTPPKRPPHQSLY